MKKRNSFPHSLRALIKRDSLSNWEFYNPVIHDKELVCVWVWGKPMWKIGDGKTHFKDLPYVERIEDIMTFRIIGRGEDNHLMGVQLELSPEQE